MVGNKTSPKKRFIAGATCPECSSIDTLQCWKEQDLEKVECVECGYSNSQLLQQEPKKTKLHKRVTEEQQVIAVFKPE